MYVSLICQCETTTTKNKKHTQTIKLTVMRTSINLFPAINSNTLQALTFEVAETLAIETTPANRKSFSAADLWRIQRNRKPAKLRRAFSLS
jgi:hypothetical protein